MSFTKSQQLYHDPMRYIKNGWFHQTHRQQCIRQGLRMVDINISPVSTRVIRQSIWENIRERRLCWISVAISQRRCLHAIPVAKRHTREINRILGSGREIQIWRHYMEMLSALCEGICWWIVEPVMLSYDVSFDVRVGLCTNSRLAGDLRRHEVYATSF